MRPPGSPPPKLPELVRAQDRLSFVYVERCVVHRDSNAVTATDDRGTIHLPAASLGALLLGPGTRISHHAVMLLAQSGSTIVWVGEHGVRYYAHGRSLAESTRLIQAQAAAVSHRDRRLEVARAMYNLRFPEEDCTGLSMQQLRGREGARVRRLYREHAGRTGVRWGRRDYDPANFDGGDAINQALSTATSCLYGVVHAVIVALGCSPALGFVHTGHERSFVYDVADLYKAETAIPIAFTIASSDTVDIAGDTRRAMRDVIHSSRLLERCAKDISRLLLGDAAESMYQADNVVMLWDDQLGAVPAGVSYGEDLDWS